MTRASVEKINAEAIIHTLDNLDVFSAIESTQRVDMREIIENADRETFLKVNERLNSRSDQLIDIGEQILAKPKRIVYRTNASRNEERLNIPPLEGIVFIGEVNGVEVEVKMLDSIPEAFTKMIAASSQEYAKDIQPIMVGRDGVIDASLIPPRVDYEEDIPVTDALLETLKNRRDTPSQDEISQLNASEKYPGENGPRIQQLQESEDKDLGSLAVTIKLDANHTEMVETEHRRIRAHYPEPVKYEKNIVWKSLRKHIVNGEPRNEVIAVTAMRDKVPQISMETEYGERTPEYGQQVPQYGRESLTYPTGAFHRIKMTADHMRYYKSGGTPDGWVRELGFTAECQGKWLIEAAYKYDYSTNHLDARATKSSLAADTTPVITREFTADHTTLAQRGIVEGESLVPDMRQIYRKLLLTIPQ